MEEYIAICRNGRGNTVKIEGIMATSREGAADYVMQEIDGVREVIAALTVKDAEFVKKILNGEDA